MNETAPLPFFHRQLNPVGSRALSHESVFIPEESAKEQHLDHSMSQENVSDKVRNLQVRLALESPDSASVSGSPLAPPLNRSRSHRASSLARDRPL